MTRQETVAQAELTNIADILAVHAENIEDGNVHAYLPQDWEAFRLDLLNVINHVTYVRDRLLPSVPKGKQS